MNKDISRKMIYLAILLPPLFYVAIVLILVFGTDLVFSELQVPFTVLVSSVVVSEFISILYISKNWNIEDPNEISQQLVKDIIRLAIYQTIALIGLVYFMFAAFVGV